jgi:hypothetical protein
MCDQDNGSKNRSAVRWFLHYTLIMTSLVNGLVMVALCLACAQSLAKGKRAQMNGCDRAKDALDIAVCTSELSKDEEAPEPVDLTASKNKPVALPRRGPASVLGRGSSSFTDYLKMNSQHPALAARNGRQQVFADKRGPAQFIAPKDASTAAVPTPEGKSSPAN